MNLREGQFNLPNLLTLARIAIVPVFVIFLFFDSRDAGFWAAALFSIAAVTDAVDGWLARRWNVETSFGKFSMSTGTGLGNTSTSRSGSPR